ncbi:MAG: DUF1326 domain-containing protein, partial [Planctomycetota bacterium]
MARRWRTWTGRFLQSVAPTAAATLTVVSSVWAGLSASGGVANGGLAASETRAVARSAAVGGTVVAAVANKAAGAKASSTELASGVIGAAKAATRGEVRGYYVESRSCQVYTGPCFANAEMALTGKDAVMAWGIADGRFEGVDVSGLNVVMVVRASETLGFGGLDAPESIKSLVIVDDRANPAQRDALVAFAKKQTGKAGRSVVRVETQPIEVSVDPGTLVGKVKAGTWVNVLTRKARPNDCICTNEVAYYPPLTSLKYFAAGVCTESEFRGRGLGNRWSLPNSRSAY